MGFRNSSNRSSPGVIGLSLLISLSSVVIHYLYVFSACFRPAETDAPLIIDADAVLTGSVALQRLESVSRRYPQVLQAAGDLQLPELSTRHAGDVHEAPDAVTFR